MNSSSQQLRKTFVVVLGLFLLVTFALAGYALGMLRAGAVADGLHVAALRTRSFENLLTQSLRVTEQIALACVPGGTTPAELQQLTARLDITLRQTPFLRSLSLLDPQGRILASSNPSNVGLMVPLADYLPPAAPGQDLLRLGTPWAGRDFAQGRGTTAAQPVRPDERSFLPVSRTVTVDGRQFTVLVALNPDYFVTSLSEGVADEEGRVDVLRYDGTLLMGTATDAAVGAPLATLMESLPLADSDSGVVDQRLPDQPAALTAYRSSRLYPLVVVTRIDRELALLAWRQQARTVLAVLASTLTVIFLLALTVYRRQQDAVRQRAEAERQLRINASVFAASSEGIIVTDAHGCIMSVNAAFSGITGYPEHEVLGANPRLLATHDGESDLVPVVEARLREAGSWQGELPLRRRDGSGFEARMAINLSLDAGGQVQHYVILLADITQRKQDERRVMELNRDFVTFLENTSDFIYFMDRDDRFRFASQALAGITGHAHWRELIGKSTTEVFPADMARIYVGDNRWVCRERRPLLNQVQPYFDARGALGWVSTSKWPIVDASGQAEGLFGISRDVTEKKLSDEKLELAASVFHSAREGIMITATDGTIIDVNEAYTQITGYSHDEVLGRNPRLLNSGQHDAAFFQAMWQSLTQQGQWYGEIWNRRKNGELFVEMLTVTTVRDTHGQPLHYLALFSDITATKAHEQQLRRLAHFDALTNLPNRVLLADRLKQAMAQAVRRRLQLAVVFLDLDGFKTVNDTHGHEAGDHLLVELARRMKKSLREGDTLARIGGDEFVAVLVDLDDTAGSTPILKRLLAAACEPVLWNGNAVLRVTASLGVTLYPQEVELDADQLQRQADQAMYQAKLAGKNQYRFFDPVQDRLVRDQHAGLEQVRLALQNHELVLHYQPQVNLRTGEVLAVEALVRWQHPQQGLLEPGLFLPLMETPALSVSLDEWVIRTALRQLQAWHEAGLTLGVSVNLGVAMLQMPDFPERVRALLAPHPDLDPRRLQFELRETRALLDVERVSEAMRGCRGLGPVFALDDFGGGYSCLAHLKRLPVSVLKVNKGFVQDLAGEDPDQPALMRAVLGLAATFGLGVVAEGVETLAHGRLLLQLGCELAQGYGIARPMPAHELPAWLPRWAQQAPAWRAGPTGGVEEKGVG